MKTFEAFMQVRAHRSCCEDLRPVIARSLGSRRLRLLGLPPAQEAELFQVPRLRGAAAARDPDHEDARPDHEDAAYSLAHAAKRTDASNPNITVENTVYKDETAATLETVGRSTDVWVKAQKYAATALCGGCNDHGICDRTTRKCICDPPFFGDHCKEFSPVGSSCDIDCGAHGHCIADRCVCQTGWSGSLCDIEACEDDCNNAGICIDKQCVCNDHFIGPTCGSVRCVHDCFGHGECVEGHCNCDEGYMGEICDQIEPQEESTWVAPDALGKGEEAPLIAHAVAYVKTAPLQTCPEGCGRHGKCSGHECTCYTGYTGSACENFCPNNCGGRGAKIFLTLILTRLEPKS